MAKPYVLLVNNNADSAVLVWDAIRGLDVEFEQTMDIADALVHLISALSDEDPPQGTVVLLVEPAPGVGLKQLHEFKKDRVTGRTPVVVCSVQRECHHGQNACCHEMDACVQTRNVNRFVRELRGVVHRLLLTARGVG